MIGSTRQIQVAVHKHHGNSLLLQDLNLSKGASVVRRELEKELNLLRSTRSTRTSLGANSDAGAGAEAAAFLGRQGKDFSFDDIKAKVNLMCYFNLNLF